MDPHYAAQPPGNIGKWQGDKTNKDKDGAGPVKAACLSCRQKKAKCDGAKPVCGQCHRKQLECIYIKSKRGGARKKRNPAAPSALVEFLKKLDSLMAVPKFDVDDVVPREGDDPTNVVRTFASREEIFRCYYNEVHPYLAVMPPRNYLVDVLPHILPDSPFLLAAQTIMTLSPHPLDPNARSAVSKRMRTAAANVLARQTLESVDRTMAAGPSLETIQALVMLAVWKWGATTDSTTAMEYITRAAQLAMNMGIPSMDADGTGFSLEGIDWRKDATRRTWWMVYGYQLSISMVSGVPPPMFPDDPRIKVDFPICSDKDRSWSTWINCIRQCMRVCNIVNELVYAGGAGMKSSPDSLGAAPDSPMQAEAKRRQMIHFDREVLELLKETEKMSTIEHVAGGEEDVVKNQQIATRFALAVTHIHIHKAQAWPEVSLFSKAMCGFPKAAGSDEEESDEDDEDEYSVAQSSISPHSNATTALPQTSHSSQSSFPQQSSQGQPSNDGRGSQLQYRQPQAAPSSYTQAQQPTQTSPSQQARPPARSRTASFSRKFSWGRSSSSSGQPRSQQAVPPVPPLPPNVGVPQLPMPSLPGPLPTFEQAMGSFMPTDSMQLGDWGSLTPQTGNVYHANGNGYTQDRSMDYRQQAGQQPYQHQQHQQHYNQPQHYSGQQYQQNAVGAQYGMSSNGHPSVSPQHIHGSLQSSPMGSSGSSPQRPPLSSPNALMRSALGSDQAGQGYNGHLPSLPNPYGNYSPQSGLSPPVPPFNPALAAQWSYNLQPQQQFANDMWQRETYPSYLPAPWFANQGGAAHLYAEYADPNVDVHQPLIELPPDPQFPVQPFMDVRGSYQSNVVTTPPLYMQMAQQQAQRPAPAESVTSNTSSKKHKAWGVDEKGDPIPTGEPVPTEMFPPGISLARCATAAHTIVRLEILHRSAALAMESTATPKWVPFCSCGLVSGAYAFLLLVLAVQAENTFGEYSEARNEEVEALLTNVKIMLGGLEAYGVMWEAIDMMAREVRAAVDAATRLPLEVQSQRSSQSPGSSLPPASLHPI